MIIWIALQHHLPIRVVDGKHIGARTNGIPIEGNVLVLQAGLGVKAIRLGRHGCEKRHRQPIDKLWIHAAYFDAICVTIYDLHAFEFILGQIQESRATVIDDLALALLQARLQFLQPHYVFAHQTDDGRMDLRMGETLDLMDVVGGSQFAGPGLGKIGQGIDALDVRL